MATKKPTPEPEVQPEPELEPEVQAAPEPVSVPRELVEVDHPEFGPAHAALMLQAADTAELEVQPDAEPEKPRDALDYIREQWGEG